MINNFEKELYEWLYTCTYFEKLFITFGELTDELDGQLVMTPEVMGINDVYVARYFRDNGRKRYMVNVAQFNTLSNLPNISENTNVLDVTKKVQAWVEEKARKKEYPQIGYDVLKLETTGVTLAAIDEDGGSKVQFQILLEYYYKED